jgi:hypothetical protein
MYRGDYTLPNVSWSWLVFVIASGVYKILVMAEAVSCNKVMLAKAGVDEWLKSS